MSCAESWNCEREIAKTGRRRIGRGFPASDKKERTVVNYLSCIVIRSGPRTIRGLYATALLILIATAIAAGAEDRPQDAQLRIAQQAWEMAAKEGWIEGIRHGDLIRPDLLSVTIDGGVVGALDPGNKAGVAALGDPADFQKPQAFSISSPTDPNYRQPVHPTDVGRASYEGRNCMNAKTMWPLFVHTIHWHDFFLYLPRPLQSGHTYVVTVETDRERDARFKYEWRLEYDEKNDHQQGHQDQSGGLLGHGQAPLRLHRLVGWRSGKSEFSGPGSV